MAIHKAKVIGQLEVNGVRAPGVTELDDEQVNLQALVSAQLVELLPEPEPEPSKPAQKRRKPAGSDE